MSEDNKDQVVKSEPNGQPEHQNRLSGGPAGMPNRRGGGNFQGGRGGGRFNGGPRKLMEDGGDNERSNYQGRGGFSGRGRRGGPGGGRDASNPRGGDGGGGGGYFNDRLLKSINGPTIDIPPQEYEEKKFNNRCRLYVGNIPQEATDEEFKNLFAQYGEISEMFLNKEKNFGFIRMDYRSNAEKAKKELDGFSFKNRNLKVRFAPTGSSIKVKNLTQHVTNELLELGFSIFGEIERAHVNVDERSNTLKEGIVEFSRKSSALSALRYCTEGCYFLTSTLKPVIVEPYDVVDDSDGYSEKSIMKKGQDFFEAREKGPRFAKQGSFEFDFGTRWKQIHELYKQKEESLKREMKLEEEKLEAQMQYARYEHETEMLREQLRQREIDRERQKREWEDRERQAEELRIVEEESGRRHQDDLSRRMLHQDDELRRRQQENSLFMQERKMTSLLDERGEGGVSNPFNNSGPPFDMEGSRQGDGNFMDNMGYNRGGRYDARADPAMEDIATRRPQQGVGGGRWGHERRIQNEDFPNKRRRF